MLLGPSTFRRRRRPTQKRPATLLPELLVVTPAYNEQVSISGVTRELLMGR
jgi:hypothetical protein